MRPTTILSILGLTLVLAACSSTSGTSISKENMNPLTASRYGDELADTMANMIIASGASIKPSMLDIINQQIARGKTLASDARATQARGMMGALIASGADTGGYGLYVDDALYLSSDFFSKPGPSLHVYLTTVVDPRDAAFPDATAIDLGEIQNNYGAQQYPVPHQEKPELLRTLVLWDTAVHRLYGFAQLSK